MLGQTAKLNESIKALQGLGASAHASRLAGTYRLATENMKGIAELSEQADRLKVDLSALSLSRCRT